MNPLGGGFTRCTRHPSQFFTGFCSSCLLERLSAIDAAGRSPKCPAEVFVAPPSLSDRHRIPHEDCERRTLLALFRLDDDAGPNQAPILENDPGADHSVGAQPSMCQESEPRLPPRFGGETSVSGLKPRSVSFWLGSVFSKNTQIWRKKGSSHRRWQKGNVEEEWPELEQRSRHSCDWKLSYDPSKAAWEDPRHSWDGSMASKAFICSFSCVEEAEDRDSDSSWPSERRRSLPEFCEGAVSSQLDSSTRTTDSSSSTAEKPSPLRTNNRKSLRHSLNEDHHHHCAAAAASGSRRKKTHRWSKVWRWGMPSHFRETPQTQRQFLERSLSESWRESCKMRAMEKMNSEELTRHRRSLSRSKGTVTGGVLHCSAKRNEHSFGRSRSIHFYSPGNLENGLLRFYLTPLRSSRRNAKSRTKTSRPFRRGIFGFY
ncbi:unnamed protein product [Spirodela intermedia]|uniref:Uncharacterized protein n=1 Tax=Spirodela intermedia TaxID=51605 RepID=A0A7I8IX73_SPIIN|nr:unnamed protein product [Spirodela intermedia]CAA6662605.1 unnamed protein product [Spirodela intermedia]